MRWSLIPILETDCDYYLSQQILPPVERLCERIEGTDRSRLAECLGKLTVSMMALWSLTGVVFLSSCAALYWIGLDPARFRSYSTAEGEELNITTLDSQIPESERYNDADSLKIQCRHCKTETDFVPIHDRQVRYNAADTVRVSLLTRLDPRRDRNPSCCQQDRRVRLVARLSEMRVSKYNWRDRSENIYRSTTLGGPCATILPVGAGRG